MSGKDGSPTMSGGARGCSMSESNRKSVVQECEAAKQDDDNDLLTTLSLGSVPVAARRAALPDNDGCFPATPTLQAPLRPVNVVKTAFDFGLSLGLAASSVVDGNVIGGGGGGAFLASDALTASTLVPMLPLPSPPHLFICGSGNDAFAVVPVHDSGIAPTGTDPFIGSSVPPSATTPPPTKGASSTAPAPPKKRRRVTKRSNKKATSAASSQHGIIAAPSSGDGDLSPDSIIPAFPWMKKNRVAEHYSLAELYERGIDAIEGEVRCKRCDVRKTLALDVRARFKDLRDFIARNVQTMDDRAPEEWKDPALPDCDECGQKNSLRPVISPDKYKINWMFLLLGQTLGLCTLEQLKHFCAHTNQHRTGAKDRVLYSTYMELCNQLWPGGPFDMAFERKNRNRPFA